VQQPRFLTVVRDAETRYPSDDVTVNGQNHLPIDVDPRHLRTHANNAKPIKTRAVRFPKEEIVWPRVVRTYIRLASSYNFSERLCFTLYRRGVFAPLRKALDTSLLEREIRVRDLKN